MGQYFKAVNTDKKEFVCPWCIGGGAKLWEWAVNPQGAIFTLLLRKSDAGGGGDYYGYKTQEIKINDADPCPHQTVLKAIQSGVAMEGQPVVAADDSIVGRWAGDRIVLVGDYDSSNLWDELDQYRNISGRLVDEWNVFIELSDMQLTHKACSGCKGNDD